MIILELVLKPVFNESCGGTVVSCYVCLPIEGRQDSFSEHLAELNSHLIEACARAASASARKIGKLIYC